MLKLTQDTDRSLRVGTALVIGISTTLRAIVNIEMDVGSVAIAYLTDIEEVISYILFIIASTKSRDRTIIELNLDMWATCEIVVIITTSIRSVVGQVERLLILIGIIVLKDGISNLVGRHICAIIESIIAESRNGISDRSHKIRCGGGRAVLYFERSRDSYC